MGTLSIQERLKNLEAAGRQQSARSGQRTTSAPDLPAGSDAVSGQSVQERLERLKEAGKRQSANSTTVSGNTSTNTAFSRSGKNRDRYDSSVRENYRKKTMPSFTKRLGSAAKSVLSGVASNAASAWGTFFQVRGGSDATELYEDYLRSIDLRIAAAEKQLEDAPANDPLREFLQQDLDQLQSQKNTYEQAIRANRGIGDLAVEAADQAAKYSQQQLDAAKQGLGPIGSTIANIGTRLGQFAVERLSPLPTVNLATGSAGAAATAYRNMLREKEAQELVALDWYNKPVIESELKHRYEDNYDPQKALGAAALGLGGYALGSLLSRGVGAAGLNVMRNAGVQNRVLPNVITGGLSGVGFSAGMTGGSELAKALTDPNYEPDWRQISTDAVAAFAFGAISSAIRIARSSSQNKAFVDQLNQEVKNRYATVKEILRSGNAQQRAQGAASVMDGVDRLRNALKNLQFVGAQKQVDSINSFLNSIDAEMAQYLRNGATPPAGAVGGPSTAIAPPVRPVAAPTAPPAAAQTVQPAAVSPAPAGVPRTARPTAAPAPSPVAPVPQTAAPMSPVTPVPETPAQSPTKPVEEAFPPVYYENIEREPAPEPETPGMTIPAGSAADLEPLAKTLGESGRKAITAFYDGETDTATYADNFLRSYNAGLSGRPRPTGQSIGEPLTVAAYVAGQNDAPKQFVEFDERGAPVFAKTRAEAQIEPADFADLKRRREAADKTFGLDQEESVSLGNYVKTLFRVLNNRLYSGTMSDKDQPMVDRITSALKKFPTFDGKTYRNLSFQDETAFNSYLSDFAQGKTVTLKSFTSTSKRPNGYPKFGDYVVHMVIEGTSGADIADTYGIPRQQEVIFLPGTQLKINSIGTANDGHPIIYAQEAERYGLAGDHGDQRPQRSNEADRPEGGTGRTSRSGDGGLDRGVQAPPQRDGGRDGLLPQRGAGGDGRTVLEVSPRYQATDKEVTENGIRREENGGVHRGDRSREQRPPDLEKQGETVQPVPQTGELHSDVREVPRQNPTQGTGERGLPGLHAQGQVSPQQGGGRSGAAESKVNSMKEDLEYERREETKEDFLRRTAGDGLTVYEGETASYGFRRAGHAAEGGYRGEIAPEAGAAYRELTALGISADIVDGPILRNSGGVTVTREVPQAVTVDRSHIFISKDAALPARNVAGHEAFHLWKDGAGRETYIETLEDNLLFSSPDFLRFQSTIAEAYFAEEADLANETQVEKLREEIFAYISGNIHEGVNDEVLRPMFRDYEAVKAAWEVLVEENKKGLASGTGPGVPEEDRMAASSGSGRKDQWFADRVGSRDKAPKSLSEIVEDIRHSFGLNITTGHIRGKGTLGTYNRRSQGIRSKIHNDLPTISHELGHHLDNTYSLTKDADRDALRELIDGLSPDMRDTYPQKKWGTEGLAEYVRKFLQNREVASIDYPQFTDYFMGKLSGRDAAILDQLADEINAYYSLGADSAASSIRLREERGPDARTLSEKIRDKGDGLYQAWVDINHGIKLFDEAVGTDTYKLATNAAYADAMAANIILHELRDAEGAYVGPGLSTVLQGINLRDKAEYRAFGEYLTVRHGPERLKEGMRIYADDRKNSSQWMQNRQHELEVQYPSFREASDRLYDFQRQLLQTWGVNTGLVSAKSAKEWGERWKFYVPFNRAMDEQQLRGARRGFANQDSTIRRARGSGRDIIHPVDNIIANMVAMVNAGVRNNVMRRITDAAERSKDYAVFLEKVPVPLKQKKFDAKDLKQDLKESILDSSLSHADKDLMVEIVSSLDDILIQYGRGKAYGDVITVMKNGTQEFWKINDPLLLQSITNMSPGKLNGILDAYAVVSRFMTGNITGKNLLWSIFSNAPRDLMTFFTYSKDKNPLHVFGGMGAAYVNKIKGGNADPIFMEYLAMGGGQTSAYTADRDLTRTARKKMSGSKADYANPMEWIAFTSDMIEMGPRFATYKMMREKGMNPQDAFYEAMDITVNFRRGGRMAREVNKVVPFFNASVQGLDKFSRWIRAADAPPTQRAKIVRSRMISYLLASAALAAVFYGLNNSDEEKEADYQQLSNFTKNSYWLMPLGDGKYFAIPKPRELGVLSSFFETTMEFFAGENPHAFDEFSDYVLDNGLPPVLSELSQGDWEGAIGSLGLIGTGAYLMANRDFLGRPIESSGLSNLEPKDRYTSRTSQIAKAVGQAFNISPQKIDYFFNSVLGGFWKAQKALFPVGKENVDLTLGIQNTYIKDNQYSLDLVNWVYGQAEKSSQAANSDPSNIGKAIEKKMDANMTNFYSRYYALSKDQPETTTHRATRQTVLDMIREYQKAYDLGSTTQAQEAVYAVCKEQNSTEYLPGVMQITVKDGNDIQHTLSDVQYVEFQTEYLGLYWEIAEDVLADGGSAAERAALLKEAKNTAKEQAVNRVLRRIGAPIVQDYDYGDIPLADVAEFNSIYSAATSDKDEDGNTIPGSKQDKVIAGIESIEGLTDKQRSELFRSVYDSDKNNPWAAEETKKYWWQ